MKAITNQFVIPFNPTPAPQIKQVYPWENTELYNVCVQLYELAKRTGYTESFEEFKTHFGLYLDQNKDLITEDFYTGQYEVTPLPLVEQILQTKQKVLRDDIVIAAIPYAETTNLAGGYTVTIG